MKSSRPQKKKPEDIRREPGVKELAMSQEDWEEFEHGVILFNSGKFWNSHEAWEQIWLRHSEDERLFFQGIIQLAAAYHQVVAKKSYTGAMNNFQKAYAKLEVFQPEYLGVRVQPLIKFIEQGKKELESLGRDGLDDFNYNLIPKLQFHKPSNPDILVELQGIVGSTEFLEATKLFNSGYFWEAHEAWEDVWREKEGGDGKTFVQAFVQMASAYSFIQLHKPTSAVYLFEKALEKFQQFEHFHCQLSLPEIVEQMKISLGTLQHSSANGNGARSIKAPIIHLGGSAEKSSTIKK